VWGRRGVVLGGPDSSFVGMTFLGSDALTMANGTLASGAGASALSVKNDNCEDAGLKPWLFFLNGSLNRELSFRRRRNLAPVQARFY
jgi:hypothetical protein